MVLTNMLPSQGNGTFVFYIWAEDRQGNHPLGERTITCDNAPHEAVRGDRHADTGRRRDGFDFVNFGWALTPLPKTIPKDGSTMNVLVDGASIGTVTYDNNRPDIQGLFPGLNNSDGAIGFRVIDTTTLANGAAHDLVDGRRQSGGDRRNRQPVLHRVEWRLCGHGSSLDGHAGDRSRDGTACRGAGAGAPRLGSRGAVAVARGREQRAHGDSWRRDRSLRSVARRQPEAHYRGTCGSATDLRRCRSAHSWTRARAGSRGRRAWGSSGPTTWCSCAGPAGGR